MAETAAQKKAREERENALREQIEKEMREKLQKEFEEKLAAQKAESDQAIADAQATATTAAAQAAPEKIKSDDPSAEGAVTIHFVDDGFTGLGKIWYRGEELTVAPGSPNWDALTDRTLGRMVLQLNEAEQVARWGRRLFAPGPWPYSREFELDREAYMRKVGDQMVFDQLAYEKDREKLASIQ